MQQLSVSTPQSHQISKPRIGGFFMSPVRALRNAVHRTPTPRKESLTSKTTPSSFDKKHGGPVVEIPPPLPLTTKKKRPNSPSPSRQIQSVEFNSTDTEDVSVMTVPRAIAMMESTSSVEAHRRPSTSGHKRPALTRSISDISDDHMFRKIKEAGISEDQLKALLAAGLVITEG